MNQQAREPAKPSSSQLIQRRGTKTVVSLALCVLFLAMGGFAFQALAKLKQSPRERKPVVKVYNVDVFPVFKTEVSESFPAYGTAEAYRDVVLAAQVAGRIIVTEETYRELNPGQRVSDEHGLAALSGSSLLCLFRVTPRGKLLFQIEPDVYLKRVEQAQLTVELDEIALSIVKAEKENNLIVLKQKIQQLLVSRKQYERTKRARKLNAASDSELADAELAWQRYLAEKTEKQNAQNLFSLKEGQILRQMEKHNSELKVAKLGLAQTRISVPFTGRLNDVFVEAGEYVRIGDPLIRLTNSSFVDIPMALAPEDFDKIKWIVQNAKNDEERPKVDLATSEKAPFRWTGRVVRVAPEADYNTRTVKVFVRVDNRSVDSRREHRTMIPGMNYYGVIAAPPLRDVMVVPRDAILAPVKPDGRKRVFVATKLKQQIRKDGTGEKPAANWSGVARTREIVIRRTFQNLAVIEVGLKDGDYVILTNLDVIFDGAKVRFSQKQIRTLKDELRKSR
ncbi:MAG: HlyD family efflux transporter periplasmic adaptor subunit [Planctomycetes bacterium]|nr:HlyD family efflux transporter periplasmic adaptor subunit [Planctomycetota bacterium]